MGELARREATNADTELVSDAHPDPLGGPITDAVLFGLGHRAHPWLGREVEDTATGRTGVLRAVAPDPDSTSEDPVAWLAPVGGGIEWTTNRRALQVTPSPCTTRQVAQ